MNTRRKTIACFTRRSGPAHTRFARIAASRRVERPARRTPRQAFLRTLSVSAEAAPTMPVRRPPWCRPKAPARHSQRDHSGSCTLPVHHLEPTP